MASNTESVGAEAATPTDVGLKREMGFIGATWASETSIIGSGWLFGAFLAAQAAGTAALLGWIIAGVIVIILALVHAELGGMYPVSGGTARFPHFAFGSIAGISFGFFSWLQAVTVAPIECFAVMQYGSYYWHGLYNSNTSNVTGLGFAMTVVLLAVFTAINFLAMRLFSKVNAGITWWKVAVPVHSKTAQSRPPRIRSTRWFQSGKMASVSRATLCRSVVHGVTGSQNRPPSANSAANRAGSPLALRMRPSHCGCSRAMTRSRRLRPPIWRI